MTAVVPLFSRTWTLKLVLGPKVWLAGVRYMVGGSGAANVRHKTYPPTTANIIPKTASPLILKGFFAANVEVFFLFGICHLISVSLFLENKYQSVFLKSQIVFQKS